MHVTCYKEYLTVVSIVGLCYFLCCQFFYFLCCQFLLFLLSVCLLYLLSVGYFYVLLNVAECLHGARSEAHLIRHVLSRYLPILISCSGAKGQWSRSVLPHLHHKNPGGGTNTGLLPSFNDS